MRVYVSCPMTGYPDWNVPLMEKIAKDLLARGHEVLLPKPEEDIRIAVTNDCKMVCEVDDALNFFGLVHWFLPPIASRTSNFFTTMEAFPEMARQRPSKSLSVCV